MITHLCVYNTDHQLLIITKCIQVHVQYMHIHVPLLCLQCCIDNTVELAGQLIEHGADLNSRDVEGWTPLHAASATGNLAMINLLLDQGASLVAINNDDKMPIDVAADGDIRYILQQRMLEAGKTDCVDG